MKTALVKFLAKIVLDNLGSLVVWMVEQSTDSIVKDSTRFQKILSVTEEVTDVTSKIAGIMKDGVVSDEESYKLLSETNDLSDKIKALL